MPIHDWTRASDAAFHSFQLDWAGFLCDHLNRGVLPSAYFAVTETVHLRPPLLLAECPEPDHDRIDPGREGLSRDVSEHPPSSRVQLRDDHRQYAHRVVVVRDADTHAPASVVLFVTRLDKQTPYRLDAVVDHAIGVVTRGIHLLVIDPFPPLRFDPEGVHGLIWQRITGVPSDKPTDRPLAITAYSTDAELAAYHEPLMVGDRLPHMPLFLTADQFVPCPLEGSYSASWSLFPAALKGPLESPPPA